jgi:hypothetical protein
MGPGEKVRKDLMEIGTSWEGMKREALSRFIWRSCFVGVFASGAAVSCWQ